MVSGGADSAILLYHLMKHSKDKIHIFSLGTNDKRRLNLSVATQVVEKCIQLTDNINIEHHINYCETQTLNSLLVMPKQFIKEKRIKIVYNGVTSNPPKKVLDTFKLKSLELDRDPSVERDVLSSYQLSLVFDRDSNVERDVLSFDDIWYSPWANIDKKTIASMFKEENLIETLFSITRSCAYDPTHHYFIENVKDPGYGHCGECWWCEERYWAFGRLQ